MDSPVPPELVIAIEQLEADLGLQWMGAAGGHRMAGEREMGYVPGLETEIDDFLSGEDKAAEQLRKAKEKQQRETQRICARLRFEKKQRLAKEITQVDNLLRAFPSYHYAAPKEQHAHRYPII